ncbi:hypothetical protein VP01_2131g2 [Puccinia sorghi]|uniref:Reverse transcriptase Ty1/copia-type domain-containing protein n=1 Tax=Puccinia sorghi TaxID=27349 RepID=A0A0L6V9R6_9BASI|nr:hypothetical protein VP01_2131g2 [Puccinia sorghi]
MFFFLCPMLSTLRLKGLDTTRVFFIQIKDRSSQIQNYMTVMLDSGLRPNLWNEALTACVLSLNQIPTHRSKKSPYELFKGASIPLNFFKPIGNPVAVLSNLKKSKLEPRGDFGKLIGLNPELKSYQIRLDDGRIVNSKNVKFLDFSSDGIVSSDYGEFIIEEKITDQHQSVPAKPVSEDSESDEVIVKEEEEDSEPMPDFQDAEEELSSNNDDVVDILVPESSNPVGRVLRDRTLQVKPIKYSHLTVEDPHTYRQGISCEKASDWKQAINNELDNIEYHNVWVDQHEKPNKFLNSTWVFRTKPETASSPEKSKARLCIQGFLQTQGKDFFETFAPTGKFPSLLALIEAISSIFKASQVSIEYSPSISDTCLFIHNNKNSFIFFHMDDLIVVGQTDEFEKLFLARFPNSMAHSPDTLLGMNLSLKPGEIELSQPTLIEKGLEMLGLTDCRPVKTPLQLHTATDEDHSAFLNLKINYRSFTGMLNYLACRTRPDLAAAVSILSQFNQRPGLTHWREVLHCWKYVKGTSDRGLLLKPSPDKLLDRIKFFTDATWAKDQETRISRSGSLAFWKSCPLMWNSKKQRNITISLTESEMNALSDGEKENQWLAFLIEELWKIKLPPTLFHIDNKGLLEKLKNFGSNSKTKHIDIKIKSLREKFKNDDIAVKLIPSSEMLADSLTKAAPLPSIKKLQDTCLTSL